MVYEYHIWQIFLESKFQKGIIVNFSLSKENGNILVNKTTIYLNSSV